MRNYKVVVFGRSDNRLRIFRTWGQFILHVFRTNQLHTRVDIIFAPPRILNTAITFRVVALEGSWWQYALRAYLAAARKRRKTYTRRSLKERTTRGCRTAVSRARPQCWTFRSWLFDLVAVKLGHVLPHLLGHGSFIVCGHHQPVEHNIFVKWRPL